ncbi:DUF2470 domain-containing protein [Micromonospora sp. NPDC092111]|uniref:DUF2470 domain-containing protein n=1 Tax=Micromonospora sp. NPDC092111 TaxID=3364289 RepID=UPI0037FF29A3
MSGQPFGPDVVGAVSRHMNEDHAADALLICRTLGGCPTATRARTTGLDGDGMDFVVTVDGVDVPIRVPFAHRLTERAEIRREVVRMYREACRHLGIEPRPADA